VSELVMGPGQNFLWLESGRVVSAIYGLGLNVEKRQFLNFFPSGQKKSLRVGSESIQVEGGSASYLLRVKSKLGSDQVRAHL